MLKTILALLLMSAIAGATPIALTGSGTISYDRHGGGTTWYASGDGLAIFGQIWMGGPSTDSLYAESSAWLPHQYISYQGIHLNFVVQIGYGTGFARIYDSSQNLIHSLDLVAWVTRTYDPGPIYFNGTRGEISISPTDPAITGFENSDSTAPEPGTIFLMAAGAALLCVTGYRRRN